MPVECLFIALGSYLVGAVPFGYLAGRGKGVNLFEAGSGNIGATNVGRVLGRTWGVAVFVLDLLKGALPVLLAGVLFETNTRDRELARVIAAASAFLGHLFPVYLGFRGGKGVATGAGTVLVLVPGQALIAVAVWIVCALLTRIVSLSSIVAVVVLAGARISTAGIEGQALPATLYCLAGALVVIVKHRTNIVRLLQGRENQIGDGTMRHAMLRIVHLFAVGFWFGGAAFFNFVVAPSLFATYKEVVENAPSDRTAFQPLGYPHAPKELQDQLANALFGAGVGPIFPKYFVMMTVCGALALATAFVWRREGPIHRNRLLLAGLALATVLAGWPVSNLVTDLRLARFSAESAVADAAKASFATWHLVSLGLSLITVLLAGVLLVLAAWLPRRDQSAGSC